MERLHVTLPEHGSFGAFLRRRASTDPAVKTWVCPSCGTITPYEVKPGLYLRRPCPCEVRQREAKEAEEIRRHLQAARCAHTFTWIGQEWVEPGLERLTFASFDRTRQRHAFEQARAFARAPQGTLALTGSYGTGKTHLLVAIANARREANQPCLYTSAVALFEAIQDRIRQDREYQPLLQRAARTPLLLLDDLDKPKPSEFRESVYYFLLNQRSRAGLPLAITCNCEPQMLDRWIGGAARSRIMHGLIPLFMNGPDHRM
ncbi:MAG TPA: DnaA/Hda family protein [Ktedonobacteraceae bacterium]|nr:DnaA/Hda family protein [Ktedonobacteraceae bacterium]